MAACVQLGAVAPSTDEQLLTQAAYRSEQRNRGVARAACGLQATITIVLVALVAWMCGGLINGRRILRDLREKQARLSGECRIARAERGARSSNVALPPRRLPLLKTRLPRTLTPRAPHTPPGEPAVS